MKTSPIQTRVAMFAAAALALGFVATAASAQSGGHSHPAGAMPAKSTPVPPAPQPGTPSVAKLQKEVDALREEVRRLKQAQQTQPAPMAKGTPPAAKKPAMQMGGEPCKDMKSGGMGMKGAGMSMDKKDDCMAMPPADAAKPGSMADDMDEMDDM